MEKKRTIQRRNKKKNRPKIRFDFWLMFTIFLLSFIACFVLYMLAANFNDDFFKDEFDQNITEITSDPANDLQIAPTTEGENPTSEAAPSPVVNPIPESEAKNDSYFDNICLLTDGTLIEMGEYGKFAPSNIFGSAEITTVGCNSTKISSSFGNVSMYDIIKNKKPDTVYIMLGKDLGTSPIEDMLASYTTLVTNLRASLPEMKIYVMQLPPVIYDTETLSNAMIDDYNNRLLAMSNAAGVYCINTNEALRSEQNILTEEYWSYEKLAISEAGYKKICDYIASHTA